MAESLENTGFEGCVGFSANYTQTIHKTRFLKIILKIFKKVLQSVLQCDTI